MTVPKELENVWISILSTIAREPDRDFSTVDIANATQLAPRFLVDLAPYLSPYAVRGAPRPGTGYMKDKMVRPWIWRMVNERLSSGGEDGTRDIRREP